MTHYPDDAVFPEPKYELCPFCDRYGVSVSQQVDWWFCVKCGRSVARLDAAVKSRPEGADD